MVMEPATSTWLHAQPVAEAAGLSLPLTPATSTGSGSCRGREVDGGVEVATPTARVGGKEVRLFPCLFCDKTFLKSQALGGHQNAHRKDRAGGAVTDPYLYAPFAGEAVAASTGRPPCGSGGARYVCISIASHGGNAAAGAPVAGARLEGRDGGGGGGGGGAPRFAGHVQLQYPCHPSGTGGYGAVDAHMVSRRTMGSGAGEALDLELRL